MNKSIQIAKIVKQNATKFLSSRTLLALTLAISASAVSAAPPLPGGATTGGNLPRLDDRKLIQPTDPAIFPIPPVMQRPLDIDEGPRIIVTEFILEGAQDHPEHGVSIAAARKILEASRAERPEGFTINRLQEVANKITTYYRKAGYIVAQAFVPQQDVSGGKVVIKVLEGQLGNVLSEGNKKYSSALLAAPFQGLIGKALHKDDIESAILIITDYPGLTAFAVFKPGEKVGTTDLVLKIKDEDAVDATVTWDNHGSQFTGEYRGRFDVSVNNIFGYADSLDMTGLYTSKPENSFFVAVGYEIPIFTPEYRLGIRHSRNEFVIDPSLSGSLIGGDTQIGSAYVRKNIVRSRAKNIYSTLDVSIKSAKTEISNSVVSVDDLSVLSLELGFDGIDTELGGINQGTIKFSRGYANVFGAMGDNGTEGSSRTGGSGRHAGAEFTKIFLDYARLQAVKKNQSILVNFNAQYSNDLLVSLEQMAIGGPDSVRAYAPSDFLVDSGIFMSVEFVFNAPGFADKPAFAGRTWGEVFQVSLFGDGAMGWTNDPTVDQEEKISVAGYGVGLQLRLPNEFDARLDFSRPLGDRKASNDRETQVYFKLNYTF